MSEWQPIETAPKDGTWVLAVWKNNLNSACAARVYGTGSWEIDADDGVATPTHWMPLPPLPAPPAPPADPVEVLREVLKVFPPRLGYGMTDAVERARDFLAVHDAQEGGGG